MPQIEPSLEEINRALRRYRDALRAEQELQARYESMPFVQFAAAFGLRDGLDLVERVEVADRITATRERLRRERSEAHDALLAMVPDGSDPLTRPGESPSRDS